VEEEKARSQQNGGILEEFPQLIAIVVLLVDILKGKSFLLPRQNKIKLSKHTKLAKM